MPPDGSPSTGVHVDLDGAAAGAAAALGLTTVDARAWGPRLRYIARGADIAAFTSWLPRPGLHAPFVLAGSGDFHHLAAVWLGRAAAQARDEREVLVCFDNHPDWDIRPPRWGCGGWINRALDVPTVERAEVWGCGNFELAWPARVWRRRDGRITARGWLERLGARGSIERSTWRQAFGEFAGSLRGRAVYVSVDLDSLAADQALTNWEAGLFTVDDLEWALATLRDRARLIGGDVCGAWSQPVYARRFQRFAAGWDHPRTPGPARPEAVNDPAMVRVFSALAGIRPAPPT